MESQRLTYSDFKLVAYIIISNHRKFSISAARLLKHIADTNCLTETVCSDREQVAEKIRIAKNMLNDRIQDRYYARLLETDFDILRSALSAIDCDTSIDRLITIGSRSLKTLNHYFGTHVDVTPPVFVVSDFPKPYDGVKTWDFMFADDEDYEKYHIEPGLYIHTGRQFPFYSEILIVHEFVHIFFNEVKPPNVKNLFRWLEEGLADWFALKVHHNMFGDDSAIEFAKCMNLLYAQAFPYSTLAEYQAYNDVLQVVFRVGGHEAILDLAKKYLNDPVSLYWNALLDDIANMRFNLVLDFKREHQITDRFDCLMGTCKHEFGLVNLSSVEYIILKTVKERIHIDNLLTTTGLDDEALQYGVKKLQGRGWLVQNDDTIEVVENVRQMIAADLINVKYEWHPST